LPPPRQGQAAAAANRVARARAKSEYPVRVRGLSSRGNSAVQRWIRVLDGARGAVRAGLLVVLFGFSCLPARAQDGQTPPAIVVFGDSQAAGLARGLQRVLAEDPRFRVLNRTHAGASLIHDEDEWLAPIRNFTEREKADIAVVMFGANDRLDMREGRTTLRFRSREWRDEYTARIDRILDRLAAAGLRVLWLGNPIARSERYSEDMSYINEVYEEAVARYGFQFMPLWTVVADAEGGYAAYGKDRLGTTQRLRGVDGIHFTAAGYELIAEKIVARLAAPAPIPVAMPGAMPIPAPGAAPAAIPTAARAAPREGGPGAKTAQ
jgi:lysophospholipase L1-like esterase